MIQLSRVVFSLRSTLGQVHTRQRQARAIFTHTAFAGDDAHVWEGYVTQGHGRGNTVGVVKICVTARYTDLSYYSQH